MLPQLAIIILMERILGFSAAYDVDHFTGPLSMLLNTQFNLVPAFPYVIGYVLLLLWLDRQAVNLQTLAFSTLAVYLLMYAFTWHSTHYISWLMPFLIPLLVWQKIALRDYVLLIGAWAAYWTVASDVGVFTSYLFSPLFGKLQLPTPPGVVLGQLVASLSLDQGHLITGARSVLSAIALWIMYECAQSLGSPNHLTRPEPQ
ncbi:MAG: hypothetical protein H7Z42_13555 [Roseiflexaceae bacterium]|nr:hypothetical protein [Roseiflexaceae bacterium]